MDKSLTPPSNSDPDLLILQIRWELKAATHPLCDAGDCDAGESPDLTLIFSDDEAELEWEIENAFRKATVDPLPQVLAMATEDVIFETPPTTQIARGNVVDDGWDDEKTEVDGHKRLVISPDSVILQTVFPG